MYGAFDTAVPTLIEFCAVTDPDAVKLPVSVRSVFDKTNLSEPPIRFLITPVEALMSTLSQPSTAILFPGIPDAGAENLTKELPCCKGRILVPELGGTFT
jgi:hypothetical protein